ncbi:reverse transcriptase domain-containing protein [Tanacetum coccineum]
MSDSEDSTITYTEVSSPFEDLLDIGSPGVNGLPMMPEDPYAYVVAAFQAPLSPNYVHGPMEPEQAPLLLEFVPEPVYPEFMPPEDEVFPAEEQPLPAAVSPTTDSPGYIADSNPKEDEEDPEEDPTNYPIDGGDNDDDDDEASDDDEDDDDDVEEDEDEEEEEHPAPANSVPPPVHRVMARIYEVSESSSALTARPIGGFRADYGFVGTLDDEIRQDPERYDTYEIYVRLDDSQDERLLMSGQLNILCRDRCAHARTARLMETEARLSRKAWVQSMDASDTARSEVRALQTIVLAQQTEIAGLRAADRARQAQLVETLALMRTLETQALIDQGVANALAARDADRSRNGEDSHDSGTGVRRQAPPARECTYPDFEKRKPLYFKVCHLYSSWKCSNMVELHVKTVGHDVAHAMTWTNLKKKMTDKYCPRGEIKKLEVEMWNLKVKGTDVVSYNQRFQELALMCGRMFPEESDKIEKYVGGLPDMIHRSVMASKPKTIKDAIEFATELMDKKIRTFAEQQSKNKRKQDDN